MGETGTERRACQRFKIPGSTVNYQKSGLIFMPKGFLEEFCPVLDISRGGVRFLTQKPLKHNSKLTVKISIPGERIPLSLVGEVRWSTFNPGKSYRYQVGVQFYPYGEKKGQNYPGNLVKIIALEQKFIDQTELDDSKLEPGGTDSFTI
jgi:hypothetical protein